MISFKNRLLDLIEDCDSFDTSFGISAVSASQLFDVDVDDIEKIVRTLCMYYGVVDACEKLESELNTTSIYTYFCVTAIGTIHDNYITQEKIVIEERDDDDDEIISSVTIPVNTVVSCDCQVTTRCRYEVDRIILTSRFPTTEGHRVYIV